MSPGGYSHLLYLTEKGREIYMAEARGQHSGPSSIRSARSVRSAHSPASSEFRAPASTCHTSKVSLHGPRWADDHYPLIETVHLETVPESVAKTHAAFWVARQMAQIHNTIIRALNASWNHSVSVESGTEEAADFLFFNQLIFRLLRHHHLSEDHFLFPAIEKLLDHPGIMEDNTKGHDSFADGLAVFEKYVFVTKPDEYNGRTLRHIIETVAPNLIQHLHDEIPTLVGLHVLNSDQLMKVWREAECMATKDQDLYTDIPFILGCQDKRFLIDGEKGSFPNLPWIREALVRRWHARKCAGVWKFCPSDLHGRRRLLSRGRTIPT